MSRVENLRQSRDKVSVKLMEFMKAVSSNMNRFVLFFEGEDEKYYSIRINSIRPDVDWVGINCSGKSNVLVIRERIEKNDKYRECFVAFFIDRDFDFDLEREEDIYVTPCYSIENLYVNNDVFKRIISAEYCIDEFCTESSDFNVARELFNFRFREYCDAIHAFNVWIMAYRMMEKSGASDSKLNINNVKFDSLVKVSLDSVIAMYEPKSVADLFPEASDVTVDLELHAESHFDREDRHEFYRGKQQLEFLRIFLTKLKEERSRNDSNIFSKKTSVKLQLSKNNIISELSQYASTPECLAIFLKGLPKAA